MGANQVSGNEQVRSEMQTFLQALHSYPERFAQDPEISFEEYWGSLAQTARTKPSRRGSDS